MSADERPKGRAMRTLLLDTNEGVRRLAPQLGEVLAHRLLIPIQSNTWHVGNTCNASLEDQPVPDPYCGAEFLKDMA
jgi:hypothetical protein